MRSRLQYAASCGILLASFLAACSGGDDAQQPATVAASTRDSGATVLPLNAESIVPVAVRWAKPAPNAIVAGPVRLQFVGQELGNVEVFHNGRLLSRAYVANDMVHAAAEVDTRQLANGSITLTAHAWNSVAGEPFTSDAEAGPLTLTIDNPVVPNRALLGAYAGNNVAAIRQFEDWLGRSVDGILGYTGNANWEDYDGSVGWAIRLWSAIDRPVFWSIPLIPNGASLEEAARGAYNDHYRKAAEKLAKFRPQDAVIYVRTGWEFNGGWFAWTSHGGRSQAFANAFRQFVTTFRSVSNRFLFEWNVSVGDVGANPEAAYPGDEYVDIVGMDFYWDLAWVSADPVNAWDSLVNRKWGLAWHQQFAAAHGKRTAYSEWGIMSSAGTPYVARAGAWFAAHDVVYQTYWNTNNAFRGKLSDGQYGAAGEQYRAEFR